MATDLLSVSDRLGASDCEFLRVSGILAQPVNAFTSLGYIAIGLWLIRRDGARRKSGWHSQRIFGVILVTLGLGSVAFHGPQPVGARWLHDISIIFALLFVVFFDLTILRILTPRAARLTGLAMAVALAVAVSVAPDVGTSLAIPIVGALVLVEIWAYRGFHRSSPDRDRTRTAYGAIALLLFAGATLNLLSRTSGPLCDPTSIIQMHGLWHLLTAATFGVWSIIAFRNRLVTGYRADA